MKAGARSRTKPRSRSEPRTRTRVAARRRPVLYEEALDANGWVAFEVDFGSDRILFSPTLERILGYTPAALATREAYRAIVHPDEIDELLSRPVLLHAGSAAHATQVCRVRHRAGHYVWIETRAFFVRGRDGAVRTMIGFLSDVSERVLAEEQLRRSYNALSEELEARVAQRTAALEVTNEELEAFTYSVSHDLRAPLRHLTGFAELLRERMADTDAASRRYLDAIAMAATRMSDMIDKLLALSRTGREQIRPMPVDLSALVREVREELAPACDGRNVEWHIGALPVVHADRQVLRNALQNLLANAVKFTAGRDPARIEVESIERDGEHEIVVRDNGAGFDMKHAGKLFGVFQRLHPASEFEGTGVGLAIVRRIVTRLGGRVWGEGLPGRGAAFHFTLPARESAAHASPAMEAP